MTLLPEVERELLRAARRPLKPDERSRHDASGRRRGRSSVTAVLVAVVALVALAFGGLLVVLLHRSSSVQPTAAGRSHPAAVNRHHGGLQPLAVARAAFPGAPVTQPGSWGEQAGPCPLAPRNPYLPRRAGCMTVLRNLDGEGRPDLVVLYGHLGTHRSAGGFYPTSFTLEVLPAGGRRFSTRVSYLNQYPAIIRVRSVTGRPGLEIFISDTHLSSGEFVGVYVFSGQQLRRAGGFWGYGGDSGQQYGFSCPTGNSAMTMQHSFVLEGPNMFGRWQRTDTTYAWVGARLVRIGQRTSSQYGLPPKNLTGVHC